MGRNGKQTLMLIFYMQIQYFVISCGAFASPHGAPSVPHDYFDFISSEWTLSGNRNPISAPSPVGHYLRWVKIPVGPFRLFFKPPLTPLAPLMHLIETELETSGLRIVLITLGWYGGEQDGLGYVTPESFCWKFEWL
ncbi:hypothetical protein GBA52_028753 [Prunus armeniaca]|nr:hypothetical protein GBA52_028753 [Prunus armeniaca]